MDIYTTDTAICSVATWVGHRKGTLFLCMYTATMSTFLFKGESSQPEPARRVFLFFILFMIDAHTITSYQSWAFKDFTEGYLVRPDPAPCLTPHQAYAHDPCQRQIVRQRHRDRAAISPRPATGRPERNTLYILPFHFLMKYSILRRKTPMCR